MYALGWLFSTAVKEGAGKLGWTIALNSRVNNTLRRCWAFSCIFVTVAWTSKRTPSPKTPLHFLAHMYVCMCESSPQLSLCLLFPICLCIFLIGLLCSCLLAAAVVEQHFVVFLPGAFFFHSLPVASRSRRARRQIQSINCTTNVVGRYWNRCRFHCCCCT